MLRRLIGVAVVFAVASCSGVPLDVAPPGQFNIGGQWALNVAQSDPPPNTQQIMARADREFIQRRVGTPSSGSLAFVTQDFPVLEATSMVIEQNNDSMGIRYDTGDYRDVSWGERKRGLWEVSAGWFEGDLVILSKAADANGSERFQLSPDGQTLVVDVEAKVDGGKIAARRVFERVPAR